MTSSILGIATETKQRVELPKSSRLQGLYVIGATGTGKSGLLENLIVQDINQNIGVCVLDPHGDLIDKVLSRIETKDENRIIYLDCLQKNHAFGLNIYHCPDPKDGEAVLRTFEQVEHVFELFWGRDIEIATRPDLSQAIRNTAYSFIYNSDTVYTGCGLVEIPLLFEEDIPRANIASILEKRNDRLFNFWKRFEHIYAQRRDQFSQMLISRSERFILNDVVRYIVGQSRTTINFREVMDQGQVLLVKLPGKYEDTTELLGSMIIAEVLTAALSRGDIPINKRRQFNIYADEFQKFASSDFSKLLTECRKYGQAVTVAHQARDFIDLKNKAATLQAANIGVFRVIPNDAHELAGIFDCSPIQGEPRKEFKRTPVGDVIEDIVSGRRHPVQVVNDFCLKFIDIVRDAHLAPREAEKDTVEIRSTGRRGTFIQRQGRYEGNEKDVKDARLKLKEWDAYFYKVMLEKNPYLSNGKRFFWLALDLRLPFVKDNGWLNYIDYNNLLLPINLNPFLMPYASEIGLVDWYYAGWMKLWQCPDNELQDCFSQYEEGTRQLLAQKLGMKIDEYFVDLYETLIPLNSPEPVNPEAKYPIPLSIEFIEKKFGLFGLQLPLRQLEYQPVDKKNTHFYLKPGTLETIRDKLIAQEVDYCIQTMQPSFEELVREVRAVNKALAEQPILGSSGVEETVTNEIPSHEVQNRIANQLSRLEKHTARVRIQGVSDTLEEYLIETEKPGNGVSEKALEERKQRILERMISKEVGIYRSKAEIDEEIRNRHVKLRTALQKPVQQKPTEQVYKKPETQQPKRSRRIESDIEEIQPSQPVLSYEESKKQELKSFGQRLWDQYEKEARMMGQHPLNYDDWYNQELEKARKIDMTN